MADPHEPARIVPQSPGDYLEVMSKAGSQSGMSWKVVVMAELLATSDGIGAALAVSRSHLDTAATMAWIVAVVGLLLMVEYLLLEPIKREVEKWRESDSD